MLQKFRQQSRVLMHKYLHPDNFWGKKEIIWNVIRSFSIILLFAWFFYRSFTAVPFLVPLGFLFFCKQREQEKRNCHQILRGQFKDFINAVAANLKTGYALENAVRESLPEMELLYGKKAYITKNLRVMIRSMDHNVTIEKLMQNFAEETELDEIKQFAEILSLAKRSGGNMSEIISDTSKIIGEKIEFQKELHVLIAAKILELRIMNAIPFMIVLYIEFTSPGYFKLLYGNGIGVMAMTICLIVYVTAYFWGNKMIQITI